MLFKLSKGLLKTSINVYIADVYNSSKNSSYTKRNECNIKDTLRDLSFLLTTWSSWEVILTVEYQHRMTL